MNFKKISIILAVLLVLLAILKIKDRKQGDRSFRAYALTVDSSRVDNINIVPKGASEKISIEKVDNVWMLNINNKKVQADGETIMDLLKQVTALKTKSVAATSKQKWTDYEVTDSTGTRIILKDGKKELADFIIGKFSYSQPKGQNPYMQQQQSIVMTSYLRQYDETEVYAVDGYLSMMFNREINSFRENTVVVGNPENWKKLIFSYPADSSFTLVNQSDKWMVNGIIADSMAVDSYFSKIRMLTNNSFDDEFELSANQKPIYSVSIEGDNFSPIKIEAYKNSLGELVFASSQNSGNFIKSEAVNKALLANKNMFFKN